MAMRNLYLGGPNVVDVLLAELATGKEIAAGAVLVDELRVRDPCFARQVLPRARRLGGVHANDLAAAALDEAAAEGAALEPDDVEVEAPELPRKKSAALEENPLASACAELVEVMRKKIAGRRLKHGGAPPSGHRLRLLLTQAGPWSAYASIEKRPVLGPPLLDWPSRFSGGRALGEEAKDAPSSAHRKLEEALAWLDTAPGPDDVVADLGAAPGGWSWVALEKGARVYAVDRADLDPSVAAHPRLTHARADAFSWIPERMPTWVLCDVIAEPDRSLALARKALASTTLRALVVTLKLKRPVSVELLESARATAKRTPGYIGRCKNLAGNKLEVTLMMRRV